MRPWSGSVLLAAVRDAAGHGRSRVLRAYAVVGGLTAVFVTLLVLLAVPVWVADAGGASATLNLAQGLLFIAGIALVVGLLLPVVLAHRRLPTAGQRPRVEAAYGGFGFALIASVYLALIITAPADAQETPPAAIAPVVDALYTLDPGFGAVPPLVVLLALVAYDRFVAG